MISLLSAAAVGLATVGLVALIAVPFFRGFSGRRRDLF